MQNCMSIVTMVFECYFFNHLLHSMASILHSMAKYGQHYEKMMMSVLQEVKGLTKNYTSSRKTSFHTKFRAQCLHGLPVLT